MGAWGTEPLQNDTALDLMGAMQDEIFNSRIKPVLDNPLGNRDETRAIINFVVNTKDAFHHWEDDVLVQCIQIIDMLAINDDVLQWRSPLKYVVSLINQRESLCMMLSKDLYLNIPEPNWVDIMDKIKKEGIKW
jgi:hypothetical protein